MSLFDTPIATLDGGALPDLAGKAVLVVNVASKCGLTPQYEGLERLQERFADKGFTVLGVPCNQVARFRPRTDPESDEVVAAITAALPDVGAP